MRRMVEGPWRRNPQLVQGLAFFGGSPPAPPPPGCAGRSPSPSKLGEDQ